LRQIKAEFVLCDLDYEALDYALHALGPLAERCTYLNATVPRVLRKLVPFGPFDLAIVGGLFDYLPDRWVTLCARNIWHTLLAPGGNLIFTNIKRGNPRQLGTDGARRERYPSLLCRSRHPAVGGPDSAGSDGSRAARQLRISSDHIDISSSKGTGTVQRALDAPQGVGPH
jgi:SAM-dependent methyltransferase